MFMQFELYRNSIIVRFTKDLAEWHHCELSTAEGVVGFGQLERCGLVAISKRHEFVYFSHRGNSFVEDPDPVYSPVCTYPGVEVLHCWEDNSKSARGVNMRHDAPVVLFPW